MHKQINRYTLVLLAVCVVSLVIFLGNACFNTKGEPREAIVAVSMLKYGNWILPVNNGVDIAYKPPFFHWCIAALSLLQGYVSEFTSRLPSALALTAMTLAGFRFFARRSGAGVAMIAAVVTLTNFEMHRAGTNCRVDMVLTAAIVLALYALYRWTEGGMRGMPWAAVLCMSAAFLTKGPVGVLLPCMVAFVYMWMRGAGFGRLLWKFALAALASCVLPLCWYAAAWAQGGDTFLELVYEENVLRFIGKMSYSSHENPWWYNVVTVVAGYVPYTLLVVMSLFAIRYKKVGGKPREWWTKLCAYVKGMDDVRLFSLLAVVLIFVFYCIPKSKRSVYLLPIYPFLAYFLAEYIVFLAKRHLRTLRAFGYVLCAVAVTVFGAFVAVRAGVVPESLFSGKHADQNIAFMRAIETSPLGFSGCLAVALPIIAGAAFIMSKRRSLQIQIAALLGVPFALFFSLDGWYTPTVLNVKTDIGVARQLGEAVPTGDIYWFTKREQSADPIRPFTVNFYLDDRVKTFDDFIPANGYLLTSDEDLPVFNERHPGYAITEIADYGHRSCDTKQWYKLYKFKKK